MTDLTWTVSLQYPVIPPCPESRRARPDPDLALTDCQAAQTDAPSVLSYTHTWYFGCIHSYADKESLTFAGTTVRNANIHRITNQPPLSSID